MAQLCLGQARITLTPEAARAFVVLAREYAAKAKALDPALSVLHNWTSLSERESTALRSSRTATSTTTASPAPHPFSQRAWPALRIYWRRRRRSQRPPPRSTYRRLPTEARRGDPRSRPARAPRSCVHAFSGSYQSAGRRQKPPRFEADVILILYRPHGGVAQPAATAEMFHADDQFWLEPARAPSAQRRDCRLGRGQSLEPVIQRLALWPSEREKGSTGISEPAFVLASQKGHWRAAAAIHFSPDNHEPSRSQQDGAIWVGCWPSVAEMRSSAGPTGSDRKDAIETSHQWSHLTSSSSSLY